MAPTKKVICYFRVSTKGQGISGLGIDAQRATVREYVNQHGLEIAAEYLEVESGKRNNRPELINAIAHARRSRATLLVAKLDRLSRNAAFLLALRDSGLPLIFCDMPGANELTVGIMAVVAEEERKMISRRTKEALEAAKRRGVKLGSARPGHWAGREGRRRAGARAGGQAAAVVHRRTAQQAYTDLLPIICDLRHQGHSMGAIAERLNRMGHTTRRGRPWNRVQISRVLQRAEVHRALGAR